VRQNYLSYDKTIFAKYRKMLETVCQRGDRFWNLHNYIKENKTLIDLFKKRISLE
jgi:hypothetical protein